jgi:hypothetical protein
MKNTQAIETPNGTLTNVQVIWDADHGTANEGWYLRSRYADGHEEDERVDGLEDLGRDASDSELRGVAFSWVFPPDGLNEDEMATLREMIEVRK